MHDGKSTVHLQKCLGCLPPANAKVPEGHHESTEGGSAYLNAGRVAVRHSLTAKVPMQATVATPPRCFCLRISNLEQHDLDKARQLIVQL